MAREISPVALAYAKVVASFQGDAEVEIGGKSKKAFGASALRVSGKIFAMISSKDRFVVKLPRNRVDELVGQAAGTRFEPSKGRIMKEWVEINGKPEARLWIALAEEARVFVADG